jgi:hypothetical protein
MKNYADWRSYKGISSGYWRQFPNDSEGRENKELEHQIRDLQITNKAKDIVIEQMKKINGFIDQMLCANRKVGELEIAARNCACSVSFQQVVYCDVLQPLTRFYTINTNFWFLFYSSSIPILGSM